MNTEDSNSAINGVAHATRVTGDANTRRTDLSLTEANHRISNGLQLAAAFLRLQELRIQDGEARAALGTAASRIDAVARLHRRIGRTNADGMIDLAAYLDEIVPEIGAATGIHCLLDRDAIRVPPKLANDIGVLVNELVTNAAKHAYGGKHGIAEITCVKDGADGLMVSARDRGPGMATDNIETMQSLGMTIVRTLVKQNGGRFEIVNAGGTEFRIYFPVRSL